jgi:hypothetical protein
MPNDRFAPSLLTLRAWPWLATLQRGAIAGIALGWLAARMGSGTGTGTGVYGAQSPGWLLFGLLVALRWIAGAHAAFKTLQRGRGALRGRLGALFHVLLPAELLGVVRLVALTLAAGVLWLLRRPVPPRPPGVVLEDRRKGMYDTIFAMNVVGAITEIPLSILLMPGLVPDEGLRVALHCTEVLLNLAIVGDRWLVNAGGHILTGSRLVLRAGLRASADVPLAEILKIDVVPKSTSLAEWSRSRGLDRFDAGVISVIDSPNVALRLASVAERTWTRWQSERARPGCLFVYVDDPEGLVRRVTAAREGLSRGVEAGAQAAIARR